MPTRRTFTTTSLVALAAAASTAIGRAFAAGPAGKTFEVTKTPAEWKKQLSPAAYHVLREHGTERPFSHPYDKLYEAGTYHCAGCDQALFSSDHKYDSKTGWPSFFQPISKTVFGTKEDRSWMMMLRIEYHCSRCGGHHGHVFEDGPKPTGLRYCNNGVALKFVPKATTN